MAIFTLTNIIVSLATLYLAKRIYYEATTGTRRRTLANQHSCLPAPKRLNTVFPSYLPTLGLDLMIANYRNIRANTLIFSWDACLKASNAHTIGVKIFGVKDTFMTNDPDNVKCLLATDFDKWSLGQERIQMMSSYLGYGVFTNEGAAWKHSREMLRPCFERTAVADVSVLNKHTERFIGLLPTDGGEVDLQPLFHELTLDIATEFLFGRSTNVLDRGADSRDVEAFIEAYEYCGDPFFNENYQKYGYVGLLLPDRKRKRCVKVINDFSDKVIEEELASSGDQADGKDTRYLFLHQLVQATQDRTVIRSELLNILAAGRDTTAALLSNLVWELSRQPTILSRLREEIASIIGDAVPTYEHLKALKYLRAILNESQRLYPIVPTNDREALVDTVIPHGGGPDGQSPVLIPKGTYVAYHTFSMHRRPEIFGHDAEKFHPDRWLSDTFRPGWAYIPFSGGPRVCIGQNFALTETMFVVVRLVQGFEIEQRDFEAWREKLTIIAIGAGGCRVGLRRRVV
ncbi:cytochrome P450 [Clathrospora elynae]|uniref:Cytochrome P450 n=1 Tax=Clathrospora elynae TaxID=706981 RepID=A0A6A5SVK0_9PLEO|nr:cytochrome P450 [Clathrospora elynae]